MKIPEFFDAVRKSTANLLGYDDVDTLTATQSLKVDLCSSLRLEMDRLMAQQLKGEAVDLRALATAAEMLERLLRPAEVAERPGSSDAREKLHELLLVAGAGGRAAERRTLTVAIGRRGRHDSGGLLSRSGRHRRPEPVRAAPQQSSDAEWLRWYRAGGSTRQAGWDSPPRGW